MLVFTLVATNGRAAAALPKLRAAPCADRHPPPRLPQTHCTSHMGRPVHHAQGGQDGVSVDRTDSIYREGAFQSAGAYKARVSVTRERTRRPSGEYVARCEVHSCDGRGAQGTKGLVAHSAGTSGRLWLALCNNSLNHPERLL